MLGVTLCGFKLNLTCVFLFFSAKDIVRQFQKHKDLHVSYYHPLWHSPVFQTFLW
jgi:hypothetical protein